MGADEFRVHGSGYIFLGTWESSFLRDIHVTETIDVSSPGSQRHVNNEQRGGDICDFHGNFGPQTAGPGKVLTGREALKTVGVLVVVVVAPELRNRGAIYVAVTQRALL